jgi:hypothetical protein
VTFDERQIADAVEIQRRSYELLLWVNDAMRRGFIPFSHVHKYTSESESAEAWLSEQFLNIPQAARPLENSGPELERFARFFLSYLRASFDLNPNPGTQLRYSGRCRCAFCADVIAASALRTKKLSAADKRRTAKLKRAYLDRLAREQPVAVDAAKVDRLLVDPGFARDLALAAYGLDLLHRLQGQGRSGPATLALWREFAWGRSGPRHIRLRTQDIIDADRRLSEALQGE